MTNLTPEELREIMHKAVTRCDLPQHSTLGVLCIITAAEWADARHLPQMIDYANTKVLEERARNKIVIDALVMMLERSVGVLRKVPFIEVPASADTTVNGVVEMLDATLRLARGER